jgi:hypothetical protein
MNASAEKLNLIETILRLEDKGILTQIKKLLAGNDASARPVQRTAVARKAGTMKGLIVHMSDDFDAPLDDLKEYME